MEFEPTEYVRKSFTVKAEEVTYANIEAVAKWCKGRLDTETTRVIGGNEIKLPVIKLQGQGEDRGKELVARLGCFVVYSKGRFRVYNEPQFYRAFEKQEPVTSETNEEDEKECNGSDECGICNPQITVEQDQTDEISVA